MRGRHSCTRFVASAQGMHLVFSSRTPNLHSNSAKLHSMKVLKNCAAFLLFNARARAPIPSACTPRAQPPPSPPPSAAAPPPFSVYFRFKNSFLHLFPFFSDSALHHVLRCRGCGRTQTPQNNCRRGATLLRSRGDLTALCNAAPLPQTGARLQSPAVALQRVQLATAHGAFGGKGQAEQQ